MKKLLFWPVLVENTETDLKWFQDLPPVQKAYNQVWMGFNTDHNQIKRIFNLVRTGLGQV